MLRPGPVSFPIVSCKIGLMICKGYLKFYNFLAKATLTRDFFSFFISLLITSVEWRYNFMWIYPEYIFYQSFFIKPGKDVKNYTKITCLIGFRL